MATRSMIAKLNIDGSVTSIYCHFDGYPENNGLLLVEHWSDEAKLDQLMKLGNISFLGIEIGEKHPFDRISTDNDEWTKTYGDMCLAYGRDRGEPEQEAQTFATVEEFIDGGNYGGIEYYYIWMEGVWACWSYKGEEIDLYSLERKADPA